MPTKLLLILCLVFINPQIIFSQNKFFNGFIINKKGDSLNCQIQNKEWNFNPKSIEVIINNEHKVYTAMDINGFGIFNSLNYKSAKVNYHLGPAGGIDLPDTFSDSTVTEQVFLRTIISGQTSLYFLQLQTRGYYFINEKDSAFIELLFRSKIKDNSAVDDITYKNTINDLFIKKGKSINFETEISPLQYNNKSLGKIIMKLNTINNYVQKDVKIENNFQFDLVAGIMLNTYLSNFIGGFHASYLTGGGSNYNFKFNNNITPTAGIAVRYMFPAAFKAIGLGLSINYNKYSATLKEVKYDSSVLAPVYYFTTWKYNAEFNLQHSEVMVNIYALAFLNRFDKIKFYFKGGISLFNSTQKVGIIENSTVNTVRVINGFPPTTTTTNVNGELFSFNSAIVQPNAGFGAAFKKHKLEFIYYLPVDFRKHPSTNDGSFKIGSMGLCYSYTIF